MESLDSAFLCWLLAISWLLIISNFRRDDAQMYHRVDAESIEALRRLRRSSQQQPKEPSRSPKRDFKENTLRSDFKAALSKLMTMDTRQQAMKDIKGMIVQNKTTTNLRIWLSVLSENRTKHAEYEVLVIGFLVSQYRKGLLDPLDGTPSLEKTVFRVCELLSRFFKDPSPPVQLACQKAWLQLYKSCMDGQPTDLKKALVYNSLESMINGGADKVSQVTAQIVVDGLLEVALVQDDIEFFREIAKPSLVLFLKTYIAHPASITALQTILSFFKINSLMPLAGSIIDKLNYHITNAAVNSVGYKIKVECCNTLGLIGQQIDYGLDMCGKLMPALEELATDKVWAVQVAGRKALGIWNERIKQWNLQFDSKQQYVSEEKIGQTRNQPIERQSEIESYNKFPPDLAAQRSPTRLIQQDVQQSRQANQKRPSSGQSRPQTEFNRPTTIYSNFMNNSEPPMRYPQRSNLQEVQQTAPSKSRLPQRTQQSKYYTADERGFLQRNTGNGGGHGHTNLDPPEYEPHNKKMDQLKKQIFQKGRPEEDGQFQQTLAYDQTLQVEQASKLIKKKEKAKLPDEDVLEKWEAVVLHLAADQLEQAYKSVLDMDDDIYFIRCLLKTGPVLDRLTKPTATRVLKKMVQVMRSDFMNQLFLRLVDNSVANRVPLILQNSRNKELTDTLQQLSRQQRYSRVASLLRSRYEQQLRSSE